MKKMFLIVATFAAILVSCDKNDVDANQSIHQKSRTEGIYVFNSKEELQKLINSTNSTESYNIRRSNTIGTSRVKSVSEQESNANEELLEELIPNDNFRNIVNDKGEFIIGNTIYRVTPLGTSYTELEHRDELESLNSEITANALYVKEKTKKIGNVYLYETFTTETNENNPVAVTRSRVSTILKASSTSASAPNIEDFPVKAPRDGPLLVVGEIKFLEMTNGIMNPCKTEEE